MASGFFVGSMISATYLSPALGGWRNVFILYGAITVLFTIPWLFTHASPEGKRRPGTPLGLASFKESILQLARSGNMWLLTLANMAFNGGAQGIIGYLPLYLQGLGWPVSAAGGVLASYNIASMIVVLPLTFLSDRPGSRRKILIGAALLSATGIGLLPFVHGAAVWVAMMMAGSVRDAFIAITLAFVNGNSGVGKAYSGMATGFLMLFMGIGNLVGPPVGNAFAVLGAGSPMIFWSCLVLSGAVCLMMAREHVLVPLSHEVPGVEEL
jgi:cyanate permease